MAGLVDELAGLAALEVAEEGLLMLERVARLPAELAAALGAVLKDVNYQASEGER